MDASALRLALVRLGLSRAQAAALWGYDIRTVKRWCSGAAPVPRIIEYVVTLMLTREPPKAKVRTEYERQAGEEADRLEAATGLKRRPSKRRQHERAEDATERFLARGGTISRPPARKPALTRRDLPGAARITDAEIEAARTPRGGWTRAQLAAWGVPWPPPKGWRDVLTGRR